MEFSELSNRVIGCAIEVHRKLGPGLLESIYEQCLAHELSLHGINFKIQHPLPVEYKGVLIDCGYRGWPRQLVAWVAQQQEEQLINRFDIGLLRPNRQKWPVSERIDRFL